VSNEKLFKKEFEEEHTEKKKGKNWFIILVAIYTKLNDIVMWFTILLNTVLILYMIKDFNVGIVLFLANQYIVIIYYAKIRKERNIEKKKKKVLA